jgi:hypothetical protein
MQAVVNGFWSSPAYTGEQGAAEQWLPCQGPRRAGASHTALARRRHCIWLLYPGRVGGEQNNACPDGVVC